jgi:hypothetical protein
MTTVEPKTSLSRALPLRTPPTKLVAEPRSLMEAVQAAVRSANEQTLQRIAAADAGIAFEPRTLLAILTYCYARRIYASHDIEDMFRRDAAFRGLCQNEFPGAYLIRRFRRLNHDALHQCLRESLRFLELRPDAGRGVIGETNLSEEAEARLTAAILMDIPE